MAGIPEKEPVDSVTSESQLLAEKQEQSDVQESTNWTSPVTQAAIDNPASPSSSDISVIPRYTRRGPRNQPGSDGNSNGLEDGSRAKETKTTKETKATKEAKAGNKTKATKETKAGKKAKADKETKTAKTTTTAANNTQVPTSAGPRTAASRPGARRSLIPTSAPFRSAASRPTASGPGPLRTAASRAVASRTAASRTTARQTVTDNDEMDEAAGESDEMAAPHGLKRKRALQSFDDDDGDDAEEQSQASKRRRQRKVKTLQDYCDGGSIPLGVKRDISAPNPADLPTVLGKIDGGNRLTCRTVPVRRTGESLPVTKENRPGRISFVDIAFDQHLINCNHRQIREYVERLSGEITISRSKETEAINKAIKEYPIPANPKKRGQIAYGQVIPADAPPQPERPEAHGPSTRRKKSPAAATPPPPSSPSLEMAGGEPSRVLPPRAAARRRATPVASTTPVAPELAPAAASSTTSAAPPAAVPAAPAEVPAAAAAPAPAAAAPSVPAAAPSAAAATTDVVPLLGQQHVYQADGPFAGMWVAPGGAVVIEGVEYVFSQVLRRGPN